ncbi:hypothetical protein B0J13DRAFT_114376 [Dactylonectria estremocensis]|uniref:Histone deacetylase domain-containing protein n=1 Tax=Dactylonectria estremocensis TaxID=1079267 RepID=A0A9P9FE63_9HYPO|nr:hypothetical protein B0J13DRAFT_114376 [Dactylonectria estremocensis]
MASPSRQPLPLRRQSSTHSIRDDDLTRSLKQLSLSTSPGRGPSSSHLSEPTTPFRTTGRRGSHSPRLPSRSPSNGRDSRSATPTLLRKASMNSLRSSNGVGSGPTPTRRASAANIMSPTSKMSPSTTPPVEKPRPTASSIAQDFFKAELEAHHGSVATRRTQTIVILHDAVYGHRFSRPRTSRSALATIVERPERVKAAVLGVSTAYVRLGGRHCEGTYAIHPRLDVHDLPGIPFRIRNTSRKVSLLSQPVTNVHGAKWMEELKTMCDAAEAKLAMGGKELQRLEMNRGTTAPAEKFHEGDLYLCAESLDAMEGALGAVCEAVDAVCSPEPGPQRAFVAIRPPGHHCSTSYPSGFCWVNNVHVGIMHAFMNHGVTHAAIIDIDLHHGDGSQAIAWEHNTRATMAAKNAAPWKKSSIGYFSLHDINSYPCEQGDEEKVKNASLCIDNAHGQTVWNVHLQSWKTEADFWQLYGTKYTVLLDKVRNFLQNQTERFKLPNQPPKAVIFFSAGFDASEWESAGMQRHQVNVPTEFYARIAQDVIKLAAEEGLHVDGRIISVLEGGYSDRALFSGVFSHLSGLAGDQDVDQSLHTTGGLGFEMGQKIGIVPEQEETEMQQGPSLDSIHAYDPSWWAGHRLDELESLMVPPASPPQKSSISSPTYFSPTHASTAKVVEPLRIRRSLSNLSGTASRPASPPPPEVPWTVAAHELSKLLIPSDRQTDSCKPEDLNAEASRVRRDRQSLINGVPPAPSAPTASRPTSRMALRERRAKPAPPVVEPNKDRASKGRRKTLAAGGFATDNVADVAGNPVRKVSRRLSEAPTTLSSRDSSSPPAFASASSPRASTTTGPGSSVTTRTPVGGPLPVKKPRTTTTTTTRKDAVPKALPRGTAKRTTVPASNARSASATTAATATQKGKSPGRAGSSSKVGDDMDKLTAGMKKIRINLITQSQKDAKQRARVEAEKAPSASVSAAVSATASSTPSVKEYEEDLKLPAPPITQQPFITPSPEPVTGYEAGAISPKQIAQPDIRTPTPPTIIPSSGLSTPLREGNPFNTGSSTDPRQVVLPASSPAIPSVAIQPDDNCPDVFISYQPEGPPPVAIRQHETLKWLPPNAPASSANTPAATPAATPSPVKKQHNLFQYTSGIPFAPRPQEPAPDADVEAKAESTQLDANLRASA